MTSSVLITSQSPTSGHRRIGGEGIGLQRGNLGGHRHPVRNTGLTPPYMSPWLLSPELLPLGCRWLSEQQPHLATSWIPYRRTPLSLDLGTTLLVPTWLMHGDEDMTP